MVFVLGCSMQNTPGASGILQDDFRKKKIKSFALKTCFGGRLAVVTSPPLTKT
jgi:hypothetical protein